MEGGNGATNGSGITHSPLGEQKRVTLAPVYVSRKVRKVRKVLNALRCFVYSAYRG